MSNSSDFFDPLGNDLITGELSFITTLDVVPPINPLTTTNSVNNNVEDPLDFMRILIKNSMLLNSLTVVKFPTTDPLNFNTAIYIMCWARNNYPVFQDLINRWGEELKYAFSNCSDKNDSDPKTSHKFKIFLDYVYLITDRYFIRTRESTIINDYNYSCSNNNSKNVKDIYFKFRQKFFFDYFNNLRNIQFDNLFTNSVVIGSSTVLCGWLDVQQAFITTIFQPLRNLTTNGVTYGQFLTNLQTIITNCYNLLISGGSLAQFILVTYPLAPFTGQNVSQFDDKLMCLYQLLLKVPSYDLNYVVFSVAGNAFIPFYVANYFTDQYVDWFAISQNNKSILSSLIGILYGFILHLMDKFIPYKSIEQNILPPDPTSGIINQGGQLLNYLTFYFTGFQQFQGIFNLYSSNTANLPDTDIEYIFGAPNDTGNRITGILSYVITKLQDFLTYPRTSNTIRLRSDNDIGSPSYFTFTAQNANSFFFGTFNLIDWSSEIMADSTVNVPSKFNLTFILTQTPQNICVDKVSETGNKLINETLEDLILNILSPETLEACFKAYVASHLNILEGLGIPTSQTYISSTLFVDEFGRINSFNGFTVNNIFEKVPATSTCPASLININFLSQYNFDNPNLSTLKYYYIAIVNYILFSICRQSDFGDLELPQLNVANMSFPFNFLPEQSNIYGNADNDNVRLLYEVYIWNQLLFSSFYGAGKFFDPVNLPSVNVCINPNWSTTPLIKNLFYLYWKYDRCFLNQISKMISDTALTTLGQLYLNGIPETEEAVPIPYDRIANAERVDRVNVKNKLLS